MTSLPWLPASTTLQCSDTPTGRASEADFLQPRSGRRESSTSTLL